MSIELKYPDQAGMAIGTDERRWELDGNFPPEGYDKKGWDTFFEQPPLTDHYYDVDDGSYYADDDIDYKFNEGNLISEVRDYIDSTYSAHYARSKFQSTEFIIDCGHGEGFALGNVLKYVQRYGKKGGYNRADLMKVLHYALIALHNHDLLELER